MRKAFLVLLTMLAVSFTANALLYSETDTSTSTESTSKNSATAEIDAEWLLEDGMEGLNIFPYEPGTYNIYFPWAVIIMSESDAKWLFSDYTIMEEEVKYWKLVLEDETLAHNETIKDFNAEVDRSERYKKLATYGIPAGFITGIIIALLSGG